MKSNNNNYNKTGKATETNRGKSNNKLFPSFPPTDSKSPILYSAHLYGEVAMQPQGEGAEQVAVARQAPRPCPTAATAVALNLDTGKPSVSW